MTLKTPQYHKLKLLLLIQMFCMGIVYEFIKILEFSWKLDCILCDAILLMNTMIHIHEKVEVL
jgi:hypothetical protein